MQFDRVQEASWKQMLASVVRRIWRTTSSGQTFKDIITGSAILSRLLRSIKRYVFRTNEGFTDNIDWDMARVFFTGHNSWQVRVDPRGREKSGVVNPGEEYDSLVNELKKRLLEVSDAESQTSVIRNVYHRNEFYHGARLPAAPDLVVVPEQEYIYREGSSDQLLDHQLSMEEICPDVIGMMVYSLQVVRIS